MSTPEEIKAEYASSLADLTFNSKPLINVLTMLAEENSPNAKVIVEAIEEHLAKVLTDVKLPILYLIDCIAKNVGGTYTTLFSQNIVSTFIGVFKAVDEKTRAEMFKLRQTWNEVFPQLKLYAIDVQINLLDPAWPVTAKLPSNSIHLNPKFLKNSTDAVPKVKVETEPSPVMPGAPSVNKETLLMQEKLIQKQKELLELQQKRLELEVLQTQVKLQEQIKQNLSKTGRSQNILLKPEVAKQLVPSLTNKSNEMNSMLLQQAKGQSQSIPTNGTKINPVSSALINAKPIRDPRLMRQQQQQDRVALIDGRTALFENNKIVPNKVGDQKVRDDPQSINKVSDLSQKSDNTKSNSSSKSRTTESALQKSPKSSRASRQGGSETTTLKSNAITDFPKVGKSEVNKKHKKKEKSDDKSLIGSKEKRLKIDNSMNSTIVNSASFKNKQSTKHRNYVRRNVGSASPDVIVQDEDLRSFGPPEKQHRLQGDLADELNAIPAVNPPSPPAAPSAPSSDMDVDLRQLPAAVGKKRSSTEALETAPAKKNKSEMLDKLFGDEDTDLRQLAINAEPRPKTPPPPIISSNDAALTSSSKIDSPKSNLEAVRAKLANATNRDKVLSKSYNKKKLRMEDQDLRQPPTSASENSKIIISPEEVSNIESGKMTKEESSKLLNKIILQIEKQKLKEAKRKDHEESFNTSLQPISDEEFNDSDFDGEKHTEAQSKTNEKVETSPPSIKDESLVPFNDKDESLIPFNDKDERLNSAPVPQKSDYMPAPFFSRDGREMRRFPGPNWRGNRSGRRNWESQPPRMPVRQWTNNSWLPQNFPAPQMFDDDQSCPEEAEPMLTNGFVNVDEIKSMAIDGISRDIRYYGETAICFIGWDDPRELTFQNDGMRKITFNDTESYVLNFNDGYKEVMCNGKPHIVRLGAPSREIFIDKVPYECFFGSPGMRIELDGVPTKVQLEGPPPPVNIGKQKRTDLVAGKINMFINATVVVPVFLDAKIQKFVLDGQTNTLKFVDALNNVLINDVLFNVQYGGLPKPLLIQDKKHFIRFSVLPKGIRPGKVKILDMESICTTSPVADENSQDGNFSDAYDPAMPITGMLDSKPAGADDSSPDRNSNSPNFYQRLLLQQQNNLDVLSNTMTPALGPSETTAGYQVDNQEAVAPSAQQPAPIVPPAAININELFQKLVASGFVTSSTDTNNSFQTKSSIVEQNALQAKPSKADSNQSQPNRMKKMSILSLKPVTFSKPETLKVRQNCLYSILYFGMQCSTCGMRFSPEASKQYSQHLDWHFRQNRKGKRNSRVATSRRWYYSMSDWKKYEELEDLDEREKNFFDEQKQAEGSDGSDDEGEIPTVTADPDSTHESCDVCREQFDQFFNEEKEEWHLKNAVRQDGKSYHPICYEDYQQSSQGRLTDETEENLPEFIEKSQEEETIPGLEIIIDDDDDDDLPQQPTPSEILSVDSNEAKLVKEDVLPPQPETREEEDDDDDVILNEVAPIKIVVDDDDDDEPIRDETTETVSRVQKVDEDDDGFVEVAGLVSLPNGKHVKIKAEPLDKDLDRSNSLILDDCSLEEEETEMEIMEPIPGKQSMIFSMDGNVEPAASVSMATANAMVGNKIKINISKPIPVINKEKDPMVNRNLPSETYIDPFEPFPPGEEPEPSTLKPALKSVKLSKLPPVRKGTEHTGLCSIM